MTIAGRRESRFSDITKVRNLGTKFYAMSGKRQTVIVAQNTGGLAEAVGETPSLGADARDIATNSPTSDTLYILTDDGVRIATLANTPVLGASVSFDPGDGRWILATANGGVPYIVTPVDGGIQVLDTAGVRTSVSTPAGVGGCRDAVIGSDDVLYVVDEQRAKIHVWRITASKALYIDSFRAKNCRDVVRVVLDPVANILFVQCKHRIVGLNVTAAGTADADILITLRQDYGNLKAAYTDMAKVGANKYWIGVDADSALNAGPEFYGRTYAAWDTANQVLFTAFPDMSVFAASNVVPYVGEIQIPPVPGIPDVPAIVVPPVVPVTPPPVVTPAAPVITSSLTASVTEDSIFNYVITATGTGPIYYDVLSPPAWLTSINHVTGAISGIPPDPGTANITITAMNSGGTDTKILVVTVASAIGNNTGVYTNGGVNASYVDGTLVYLVGDFTAVTDSSGTVTRNRAACLNASTGLWTAWNPNIGPSSSPLAVHKHRGYIYIGTGNAAPTFNGATVSYAARVDATTGTRDASWAPTFNGATAVFSSDDDVDLFVCGSFTTVNASARPCVCNFVDTALSSWFVQASDGNQLLTHTGGPISSIQAVVKSGASVMLIAASLKCVRNAGGFWCGSWAVANASSGTLSQMGEGFPSFNTQGVSKQSTYLASGAVVATYISSLGGTAINNLPNQIATGKLFYATSSITFGGVTSPKADFPGTGGNFYGACSASDGGMLIGGDYTGLTGYTNRKNLNKYNPTSGAVDTGFTYYARQNSTAQLSNQPVWGVKPILGDVVVAYGSFGNAAGNHQYGGFPFQGVLVLNGLTGARL